MAQSRYDCVVIGAGVSGLSIALELGNRGYKVAVVAKDLPEDSQSVGFASPWAGCNWCSFADNNKREQEWDRKTYVALSKLAKEHPELCELIPFRTFEKNTSPEPWFKNLVRDYEVVKDGSCKPGQRLVKYSSFVIHAPRYLLHLAALLRHRGVPIQRQRLASLQEAYNLPGIGPVSLVVNASGLGAKSLLGSGETSDIYPIRGQTVLVHAPGVKTCYMLTEDHPDASTTKDTKIPEPTYIIPRPGKEEHVVLGGSFQVNDWEYAPDYELSKRILQRNYALCPALAGPNGKSWEDIEIVSHNVGFRPARAGGAILELQRVKFEGASRLLVPRYTSVATRAEAPVLQAYGLGPAGFQASIGYAHEAADIVDGWFAANRSAQAKL